VGLNISEGFYAPAGTEVFDLLDARKWYVLANFHEMGRGGISIRLCLACYLYVISCSGEPHTAARVCERMADGVDCPEAIKQWFARCLPKIASYTDQGWPDPVAEIAKEQWSFGLRSAGPRAVRAALGYLRLDCEGMRVMRSLG
jgi:hypothetical protein